MAEMRRALVTGGGRGIGRACAAALTAAGWQVTVWGRTRATLDDAVAAGDAASAAVVDVTDPDAIARAADSGGPFGLLVNNAGAASTAPFLKTSREAFRAMMAVNGESAIEVTRAVLPGMLDRGSGRIVTVASMAGLKGYGYVTAYVTAKHAVVGFTRALAIELARTGVTVNAVCPGYTDTDLVDNGVRTIMARTGRSEAEARAHFEGSNPLGRLVRPDEVAAAVVWLASDAAAAVTGACIPVAGGES